MKDFIWCRKVDIINYSSVRLWIIFHKDRIHDKLNWFFIFQIFIIYFGIVESIIMIRHFPTIVNIVCYCVQYFIIFISVSLLMSVYCSDIVLTIANIITHNIMSSIVGMLHNLLKFFILIIIWWSLNSHFSLTVK